jgi:hypothetical protein
MCLVDNMCVHACVCVCSCVCVCECVYVCVHVCVSIRAHTRKRRHLLQVKPGQAPILNEARSWVHEQLCAIYILALGVIRAGVSVVGHTAHCGTKATAQRERPRGTVPL